MSAWTSDREALAIPRVSELDSAKHSVKAMATVTVWTVVPELLLATVATVSGAETMRTKTWS